MKKCAFWRLLRDSLSVLVLLLPIWASAEVYQCITISGKTTFSDRPCEDSSDGIVNVSESPKKETSTKTGRAAEQKKRQGLGTYIDRANGISTKPKQ